MYFYSLSGLINGISSALLGLFVFFKNRRAKDNQSFALFCLGIVIWSLGYYFWPLAETKANTLFWFQILHIGAILIPILYFHFIVVWLDLYQQKKRIIKLSYFITFIFLIFVFSPLFIKNMAPKFGFKFWGIPGILYHFFIIYFFVYAIYVVYLLLSFYQKSKGVQRTQTKYILIGTIIGYLGGATNYPLWYNIPIYPVGTILVSVYISIIAYAIIRYRLMDIRVVIKRGAIFSGLVAAVTSVYILAAYLLGWSLFGGAYTFKSQIITGLIVAVFTAVGFRPLYDWLKKTTDKFLFKGEYQPEELMANTIDALARNLDLDRIIKILKDEISAALRTEKTEVIILEELKESKKGKQIPLKKIIECFNIQKDVLVLEELKRKHSEGVVVKQYLPLIKELEKMEMALAIPLFVKEKLVGLFLLGAKKSGDMFTNEDIRTLEAIASQAAIAAENARLYEEMKDFSRTLQKEVTRQTKILRNANVKLQRLDQAKSDFVSLASHQLRAPLTAMMGYIHMILEGDYGPLNQELRGELTIVYKSAERLILLVEDLLTLSRIEAGKIKFDFELASLEDLTKSAIEELRFLADKKGLYIKYLEPKKPLAKVKMDVLKIRQVIQNLINNAIQYTEKGGATIVLSQKADKVVFSVQDTGLGVSEIDKVTLFEKFSRGEGASKVYTEGAGLGLYLAAKLVKAHQGRIWAESKGKGQGSTFFFELPREK